jgi:hypothetical protein
MEKNPSIHLQEVLFGSADKTESKRIKSLEKQGLIRKIAPRIYTSNLTEDPSDIIKRNWYQILSNQYSGAMLSHRSAIEFKPAGNQHIFLTYSYTKNIEIPGLVIHFMKGFDPIEGDKIFFGNIFVSQEARAILENLQPSRKSETISKKISLEKLEEKLELILKTRNEESLNQLRDDARVIASQTGMEKEYEKLNKIVSALLTTHTSKILTSEVAKARVLGEPFDTNRIQLFEKLYNSLTDKTFPIHLDKNESDLSYKNFGFFEGYFSNYIEGTVFEIDEAKQIISNKTPIPSRNEDSHDVLGTYNIVSNRTEMSIRPKDAKQFIDILQYRHKIILSARQSKNPGQFKDRNNFAGATSFVDFNLVIGTLKKGFDYYSALQHPFAKALYIMFLVSEVHPFLDGNGRMARIMMNAELSSNNQAKIIIPTVYRDDYMGALKKLTQQGDPETYIRMMQRAHEFSKNIYDESMDNMEQYLHDSDAFKEHNKGKLKIISRNIEEVKRQTYELLTGIKTDSIYKFSESSIEFILKDKSAFLVIKKIILEPKFQWQKPDDWSRVLLKQNLQLKVTCTNSKSEIHSKSYIVNNYNSGNYFQPVFPIQAAIIIPLNVLERNSFSNEFPIHVVIELTCSEQSLEFDVSFVYDAVLD